MTRQPVPATIPTPCRAPEETTAPAGSVEMPRADTELSRLLARDPMLCVKRPVPPRRASARRGAVQAPDCECGRMTLPMRKDAAEATSEDPVAPDAVTTDARLSRVVTAWPTLPEEIRAALVTAVEEVVGG